MKTIIAWFREDLRLIDNPMLTQAVNDADFVVPVFIFEDILDYPAASDRAIGGATRWWLHRSLMSLNGSLEQYGGSLILRRGSTLDILKSLIAETKATGVYWNRRYHSDGIAVDKQVKTDIKTAGLEAQSFNGRLLHEPWEVETKSGGPFKVYTPFRRSVESKAPVREPQSAPTQIPMPPLPPDSDRLEDWSLLPQKPDWSGGMQATWTPGEQGAAERLSTFLQKRVFSYKSDRDLPAVDATSRLSPHLRFGEISPHQIWHAVKIRAEACAASADQQAGIDTYLAEIIWREFSYHLLFQHQALHTDNFQAKFNTFPWDDADQATLVAWQRGKTGYPIVDAAMRQLWHEGWMHNRLRMIVGSFLVKHLLLHWSHGERWFWDTLVDADHASNAASWQWVAGTGADAAPYFRIFNPMTQGEKFDPNGDFVRTWVPELAALPKKYIHQPWEAPEQILKAADVRLGETFPHPIVDHKRARQRALDAFEETKKAS